MLACGDRFDNRSLRHFTEDRVIFKNVRRQYKLQDKITVDYILSPKTKTSTHDYVGIYPRNWTNLKDFVGFEYTITPPCEEPSLFRCVQFICQPPHISAVPRLDYQFVYVTQANEVLGKSNYFQFVEHHDSKYSDRSPQFQNENVPRQTSENTNIQLPPDEISYTDFYFQNPGMEYNRVTGAVFTDVGTRGLDEASNAFYTLQEPSHSNFVSEVPYRPKRGRPLVKTRENARYELRNSPAQSMQNRHYPSFLKTQSIDSVPDMPYIPMYHQENLLQAANQNWLALNPWHYQGKQGKWKGDNSSNLTVNQKNLSFGSSDVKQGAIPKRCPKCRIPSDYNYQQQLMKHELAQAHEEIRDLRSEVDRLKHVLELSEAGQAKLRVIAEMARKEGRYALDFVNSLMFNIVTQYRTKIVNFDNSVIYVTRESPTSSNILPESPPKTIYCGRPPGVRLISGREKELKAIIGRQEMKIRDLHAKLCVANKIIEQSNLGNNDVQVGLSDGLKAENVNSSQLTPFSHESSPKSLSHVSKINGENVLRDRSADQLHNDSLTWRSEQLQFVTVVDVHKPDDMHLNFVTSGNTHVKAEELVEEKSCGVTLEECESKVEIRAIPNETNNNNYEAQNMNSGDTSSKLMCSICEPNVYVSDVCDTAFASSGTDVN